MAVWPATLPHAPLVEGFSYDPVPQSISTEMDSGPPKRRRRFSTAYGRYAMSFLLTGAQRATFQSFHDSDLSGGSGTITGFPDPVDKSTATFQFASGGEPRWSPVSPSGSATDMRWLLSVAWDRVG